MEKKQTNSLHLTSEQLAKKLIDKLTNRKSELDQKKNFGISKKEIKEYNRLVELQSLVCFDKDLLEEKIVLN